MARTHGRAPKGERCRAPLPHGHWKTTTFVGALTLDGMTAPWVIDGAMDGEMFLLWVQTQLVPVLRPGDTVILDNLPAHKPAAIREAIEDIGAVLAFLPPYSPDFNPIELAFSKLKTWLRSCAARTKEALDQAIAAGIERITQSDCRSFFAAAGYEPE
jgi:transposase